MGTVIVNKVVIKRIKGRELSATLRAMPVGSQIYIPEAEFRAMSVYRACYRLRTKEGLCFVCTSKGCIDGCTVTRTA